jgi:hypothetical protein
MPDDFVTASYRSLYLEYCREQGQLPADMLFR